ncbi:MAG: hypothetical protein HQ547_03305 [Candidatus Omnitrophica bacterium]|nr:hypothetical protein [Candidatus Omnitrophota bacterium]
MKIFIITVDEPLYTAATFRILLSSCKGIVGVSFIKGMFTKRRLLTTLRIRGLWKSLRLACIFLSTLLTGGRVHKLFKRHEPPIPVYPVDDINSKRFLDKLKELDIDLIISFNCPAVLKKEILNLPKRGCLNVHFGMLPEYRGLFPIFYAILNGEKEFGITVHYMNEKLDDGSILLQEAVKINENDDIFSLYPIAFKKAGELLVKAIKLIPEGSVKTTFNDSSKMTYYSYPESKLISKYRRLFK